MQSAQTWEGTIQSAENFPREGSRKKSGPQSRQRSPQKCPPKEEVLGSMCIQTPPVHKSVPRGFPDIGALALKRSQGNERKDPCTQTEHSRENWGKAELSGKDPFFRLIGTPETWQYLVVCCSQIGYLCFRSLYCCVRTTWPKAIGKKGVHFSLYFQVTVIPEGDQGRDLKAGMHALLCAIAFTQGTFHSQGSVAGTRGVAVC